MPLIVIAANSTWNLTNFRAGLIKALLSEQYGVVTISPDRQGMELDAGPIPHRIWKIIRSGRNFLQELFAFLDIAKILRRERPDVYLGFTIKPNIYGCLACRFLGIPAVPNVSGLGTSFLSGTRFRRAALFMYRVAFARARIVFFQNVDDQKLFLSEKVVRADQCCVLPGSGISLTHFTPSELPRRSRFLMIARLLGDKGVREYVEAARKVKANFPSAEFALLGDLDHQNLSAVDADELDEWIREGVIEYLGTTSDVRPFIHESAAVVLPSYREGLPRTLLEGAATGRPLIATNVPGCKAVVRDGITGFLCEARDPDSLAAAMESFLALPYERRASMGAQARAVAENEFAEEFVLRAYLDVVRNITAKSER